ncbi:hypothetical protein EPA93_30265 [Ktedonosporobacter rubrisoli]|uniref:Uncharacterized protein n=1 Tax=Ktedonosporobacter rubrisoli TaxID=2509675 RepID=A0A4P6JWG1_KTERU|nr:hypothetical protein [Ktedonosporobacter rubrisoli]QBD80038.1 hypothetical protein EPA93_30265 [Ktedonosporobacter rubrisoli]
MMAKDNQSEQKQGASVSKATNNGEISTSSTARKARESAKNNKTRVGGTAVPGAKSTAPKPVTQTNNPNQQQAESYNRMMRRRMQRLGTGPYSENQQVQKMQEKRKKRKERKEQVMLEKRQEARKAVPAARLALGNKVVYFVVGTAAILILVIVLFLILRHPF